MDPLLFFQAVVRRYDTTCLLSVSPCVFLGCLFRVARCRPRVPDVYKYPSYGFLLIILSVLYLLSGARSFQRCFRLNGYLLVDPIFVCFVWLNSLATFAGNAPVIS